MFVIFYSWQSDLPEKTNRYFVRDCLRDAVKSLNTELVLSEADREEHAIKLTHDTEGVPGTPDLVTTILNKIEACDMFVGDVSFVAACNHNRKLIPNANVLIELGYALKALGSEKITLLMDAAYGPPDELPFDLRHKRHPIVFASNAEDMKRERKSLTDKFILAVRPHLAAKRETKTGVVDFKLDITYESSWLSPHIGQWLFCIRLLGTNTQSTAIRQYAVEIGVPRVLVHLNSQLGRMLPDKSTDSQLVYQIPQTFEQPQPPLLNGRPEVLGTVRCILAKHNVDQWASLMQSPIRVQMYGDDIITQGQDFPMPDLIRLMQIDPEGLSPNQRTYVLDA